MSADYAVNNVTVIKNDSATTSSVSGNECKEPTLENNLRA